MAIGNQIAGCGADVTIEVPSAPAGWQFLVDGIPMQLASELLAQLRGEYADLFRFCAYVIEVLVLRVSGKIQVGSRPCSGFIG